MSDALLTLPEVAHAFDHARPPHPQCRAVVIVPARNEEASLAATLGALRQQEGLRSEEYEVLLLLNNCTDRSAAVAERYAVDHPDFQLQVFECGLAPEVAHVGTARRALMDVACSRLEDVGADDAAILSTDADTLVAPDWITRNLAAIERGAEAVGGVIHLLPDDLEALEPGTRLAYERDRQYQRLMARLESLLDPDPADPWPRHLEHFGASLACTPEVYRRAGGLPPVKPLEDVAFVDALRKVGARIRHAPDVNIYTSARLDGRAEVGLSWMLRQWRDEAKRGLPQMVESAEWLAHRFATLAALRNFNVGELQAYPELWHERLERLRRENLPVPRFLELLDCNALIDEVFEALPERPQRHDEIVSAIHRLEQLTASS
jgi:GT2 family glycosyltransferase